LHPGSYRAVTGPERTTCAQGPAEPFRVIPRDLLVDLTILGLGVVLALRGSLSFGAIIIVSGLIALGRDVSEPVHRIIEAAPLAAAFLAALSVDAFVAMGFDFSADSTGWIYADGAIALVCGLLAIREWFRFRRGNSASHAN
jgi:hypothetical protein